ncbi:MAG: 50S ribosomal protein L4 [Dehalococcoidia bacterium]|jgi:large subunit ribosomal protein L4|nr:50S ribosomal protein L4 [Dehalococcoidia bacterium]
MNLPIRNLQGETVGDADVSDLLVGVPLSTGLVHQALVRQRANGRAGTHSTKVRGQVRGGGRKPWKQKYTGRARVGSIRSPLWRSGGVTFGPKPNDHRQDMPKRMRRQALRGALSSKVRDGELVLIDAFGLDDARTKTMAGILDRLGVSGPTLIVTRAPEPQVVLSARNLHRVKTLPADYLNVGDLLAHTNVVITVDALRRAEELWARSGRKGDR